ncbi:zinc metalloprotease [Corynebacterium flavescens]
MSVITSSLVGDYARAVSQFQVASAGSYAGPSMPMDVLHSLISSTDGINPQDLVSSTGAAVGKQGRGSRSGLGGLGGFLLDTALSFAGGVLQEHIRGVQEDHEQQTRDTRQLQESAQECSTAIGDVVDVSDSALTELFSAAIPLLNLLSMVLSKHPLGKIIVPMISAIGGDLIEKTNQTIASTCRDRDAAIEACYEEFESRCENLSQKPLPQTPPEPDCAAQAEPAPQPKPSSPECPAPLSQEACPPSTQPAQAPPASTSPASTPPAPASSAPAPTPAPADPGQCPPQTAPAAAHPSPASPPAPPAPGIDKQAPPCETQPAETPPCEPQACPPLPVVPSSCEPAVSQTHVEVEKSCCGCLGAAGAGIALVGLGILVAVAAECLAAEIPVPEPCPEPEPVPEPEPCPEQVQEPEPQPDPEPCPEPEPRPEPAPEPKAVPPAAEGVIAPPPELAEVPEPDPPPKKLMNMPAAVEVSEPKPESEGAVAEPLSPASEQALTPEKAEYKGRARKAGQW